MEKITKKELAKIIQEEYERATIKVNLSNKLKTINEEIAKLEEVEVGPEMNNGDVHDGQATPEFDLKGTHLIEGFEDQAVVKGDDIYMIDQKVGSFKDGEPVIDPAYSMVNTPAFITKVKSLYTAPAIAECDNMSTEDSIDFEQVPAENSEKEWVFEGKNRLLKLGGLIKEEE